MKKILCVQYICSLFTNSAVLLKSEQISKCEYSFCKKVDFSKRM